MNPTEQENESADFGSLFHRAVAGDVEAQDLICRQYEPKVRVVARVLLGPALRNYFDTLDIVQSVHRSLLFGLRNQKFEIKCPEQLVALAGVMVRRKVARKWQIHRREHERRQSIANADDPKLDIQSVSDHGASPVDRTEYQEQLDRLHANLDEMERRMLQLRLEGFNHREVAERLGLHPVAIRVRWTRLRKRLQAAGLVTDWMN